ncbi:uncharacterized protein LOC127847954 [Dreissena polymorpha]|uniref:Mab-21-like HhH/H2TH-like domain-containing protein n=1 Tax=Dreissena polymorpha TaxID=45954 RepID=A0A9D4DME9_DREPO|nr:uncharacterized protein LOC127847954 [Dreissena polymorpha]KAH3751949.1 hypothetical protein DPMN_186557 [Dreissena polymorpha]
MEMPEYFTEWSIRMTEVLADIGAGKDTVIERRRTFLRMECMAEIASKYNGQDFECFHFGSQSEGTTTPGLESDIDFLASDNTANIMKDWGHWKAGMRNLLMLKDDFTPPQQYLLQKIRSDTPEPVTSLRCDLAVKKDSGEVLYSADRIKEYIEKFIIENLNDNRENIHRNGPSVSNKPNWDNVPAFHVCKPLPEIQQWIDRCRGRHWPSVQLLDAARVAPCFLVPAGHPDSDYKREEWRPSPNLIERMMMFSFNMTQIKCYIILKLIKKALFTKIVGDVITSFHCKTLMFYTIERTHPSLWFGHNLLILISNCLCILRKSLLLGRLPHYIIHGVNLFDGKVSKMQQRRLLVYVDSMIRSNLQDVLTIDIDKIGSRLRACSIVQAGEKRRVCVRDRISLLLNFESVNLCSKMLVAIKYKMHSSNTTVQQNITCLLRNVFYCSTNVRMKTVALECIKHLYVVHTLMQLSNCLRFGNVFDINIIRRLKHTLNTDVASNRLKLASILYCSGHIHAAVRVLEDVRRRFHSKVKAVCSYRVLVIDGVRDLNVFNNMLTGNSDNGLSEEHFAFCVQFSRQESYCTPVALLFEMNRNITEEGVAQRHFAAKRWMDSAEVDARPLLHYLQYLSYGGLGERHKQQCALLALKSCIFDTSNTINRYHFETAMNLLGHCHEMEGDYTKALHFYSESLSCYNTSNNAANWHVRRVLRLISG